MSDRIQKVLATAGIASRRAIEEMIREGRVLVNGRPAEIGQKVDHNDHVRVDGQAVTLSRKDAPVQVLLYRKRVGELVTRDDPEGRRTVFRKLPELDAGRWISIGRLDINTSGLLLMTNHGELARRLTHPSFEMAREYAVRVLGEISGDILDLLRRGVELDDGPAHFTTIVRGNHEDDEAGPDHGGSANRWYIVTVNQGRNRVVRRLFESQGFQVSRLIRIGYGPIQLGRGIRTGSYREATPEELKALLKGVKLDATVAPAKPVKSASRAEGASVRPPRPAWAQKKERQTARERSEHEPATSKRPTLKLKKSGAPARSKPDRAAAPAAKPKPRPKKPGH